jgi:hypothetical protein
VVLGPAVGTDRPRGWRLRLFAGVALLAAIVVAASASAELTQRGNLFIRFDGGIGPQKLPRHTPAPISVRIEGTIKVPPGEDPPALRRIKVALNRAGQLNTQGLPVCHRGQIAVGNSADALTACGTALVGSGGIVARTTLPDQSATTVRGDLLLFNSVVHGREAILGHIYQTHPVPITRIVVFEIRRKAGTFGTVITAEITPAIERNGYLKSIFLQLERRYAFRGQQRSYLSAACSAPPGFTLATFPFAEAAMSFDDGRTLSSTLVRSCGVKGP